MPSFRDPALSGEVVTGIDSTGQNGPMELEYDERPWGNYTVLSDADDHKVKEIVVLPGKRLSYQQHAKRSEHWFVVRGNGTVTLDGVDIPVGPGSTIDVELEMPHRMANTGDEELLFVEVQHGTYFGEDDIIRLDDDFGRAQ
jgi:mannose-6-phosphate isomerase-like protein (cupin superfamily)